MSISGGDDLTIRASVDDDATTDLRRIRSEVEQTGRSAESAGKRAGIGARGFDSMARGIGRVAKFAGRTTLYAIGGIGTALGLVAGAAAAMGIKTAANMETAKIAFSTMLGSGKKADRFLRQLAAFAKKTPFEFPELQTAASSLISAGIEADKVIPIMTTLGDVTSGMGTGSEGVKRATVALQQMSAAGRITGEDLNQLRDAGVPVFDLLAAATGRSKKEVAGLAQEGKLGAKELGQLMKALETGKGLERFNGLMEKQSASLSGVWSTLKDTVNMGLAKAFQPAIPVLKDLVNWASKTATKGLPAVQQFIGTAIRLGKRLKGAFDRRGLEGIATVIHDKFGIKSTKVLRTVKGIVDDVGIVFSEVLVPAIEDASGALPLFLSPLGIARELLGFVADHTDLAKVALEGLIIVLTLAKAAQVGKNAVDAIQLARLKLLTPGTGLYAIKTGIVAGATAVWTGAQWALNTALNANPIGLLVLAIGLLVIAFVIAWKKSEKFRDIVKGALKQVGRFFTWLYDHAVKPAFRGIGNAIGWVLDRLGDLFGALGNVPGFGWADRAADKLHKAADAARGFGEEVRNIPSYKKVVIDSIVRHQGGRVGDPVGDTSTSRARGAGSIADTLRFHAAATHATGAHPRITNALVGGGGRGRGSGDHQAGRALDLQGPGTDRYGKFVRAAGGFAEYHGSGRGRHLHAVPPPAGDTASSRRGGGRTVVVERGAVQVDARGNTNAGDLRHAVKQALTEALRDAEERS